MRAPACISRDGIDQRTDRVNGDRDLITAVESERISGHDAGAREQEASVRKGGLAKEEFSQRVQAALDAGDFGGAGEDVLPRAGDANLDLSRRRQGDVAVAAEPNAAPDRGGITVFRDSTSHQRPQQVNGVVRRWRACTVLDLFSDDMRRQIERLRETVLGARGLVGRGQALGLDAVGERG